MYLYGWQWSSKYQTSSGILKTKTRFEMRCRSLHPITLSWAELHCHGLSWCQHTPPPPHTSRWRSSCCPSSHKGGESQISADLSERFQIAKMYNWLQLHIMSYQVSNTFEWNNLLASTSSSFAIPGAKFPCCEFAAHRGEWAQQSHLFPKHPNFQDLKKCKSKVGPKSLGLLFLEKGRSIGKPCPHKESSQPNSIWRNTHLFNMQGHYLNVKSSYDFSLRDLG